MSERIPTGMALMEAQAEMALAEQARLRAIEQRAASPEVSALNDQAMFEIYGSEIAITGNSYGKDNKKENASLDPDYRSQAVKEVAGMVSYTVVDDEGNVIGSPEKPLRGKLDEIRSNPRFDSLPPRERELANHSCRASVALGG